jgi:hypothetical protein
MSSSKLSLSFRIFQNGQLIREETLTQGVIKIGKVASAHLRIEDESVSRMHAIVEVTGDEISLIDLGSTRGTFVNGQRINKAKLQGGDSITLGDTRLELAVNQAAVAAAPRSAPRPPAMPVATMTMPVAPARPPAMPAATMPAPVTPAPMPMPMPMMPAAMPTSAPVFQADAMDDVGGARAVEVAAMFGDSVVGVKHCMDPRSGKVTPTTWGFVAGGLACLLTSGIAFAVSVNTAARNKGALDYWTRVAHKPARAFRPAATGPATDYMAFGGLAFGLLGVTAGLARARRERRSPYYRIGTAPGVELALETAPAASFPLVAPSGDDFVFNYGAGIDGELILDGKSTPLGELAAAGRARPSATTAGAIEVPIPPRARIRARSGNTTFLVSAVAKPRQQAVPLFNMQNRTMAYFAGSLAVHLGVWAFLQTIPEETSSVDVSFAVKEPTNMHSSTTDHETTPPPVEEATPGEDGGKEGSGATMALAEGASGTTKSDRKDGHIQIKNNNADPQLARAEAIKYAQTAGFLGSESVLQGGIHSLASQAEFSSGFDGSDVNGALFGAEGESAGVFGGGRKDWGAGGGCALPPCGIIGTGRYGTIGNGDRAGDGWGGPGKGNGRMRNHTVVPVGSILGRPTSGGGLDRAIIKRYIKRNVNKIAYCYEKQLLAHPGMEGEVSVQFFISPTGAVQSSAGKGFDETVASCVADVIASIEFPKPTDGGGVQVNYPFNFHAAGQGQ